MSVKTVRARNRSRHVHDVGDGRMVAPGEEITVPADHPALGRWLVARKTTTPKPKRAAAPATSSEERA